MAEVHHTHPRIYHYTNWQGVTGILDTNSIWATNIRFLNDPSEFVIARKMLAAEILPVAELFIERAMAENSDARNYIDANGGTKGQADRLVTDTLQSMYQVSGEDFYVASFCGQPLDDYEKENGLGSS